VRILLESHGPLTVGIRGLMDALGNPPRASISIAGNSWLVGADPVAITKEFQGLIGHVPWKDLGAKVEDKRGRMFGCGFPNIGLAEGASTPPESA
jgi:inosose dehydratase